jgi:hypothetical protein
MGLHCTKESCDDENVVPHYNNTPPFSLDSKPGNNAEADHVDSTMSHLRGTSFSLSTSQHSPPPEPLSLFPARTKGTPPQSRKLTETNRLPSGTNRPSSPLHVQLSSQTVLDSALKPAVPANRRHSQGAAANPLVPLVSPSNKRRQSQSLSFQSVQLDELATGASLDHRRSEARTIPDHHGDKGGCQSPPAALPLIRAAAHNEFLPLHNRRTTLTTANRSTPHLTGPSTSWATSSSSRGSRRSEEHRSVRFEKMAVMLTRDSDCDGQCDSFLRSVRQSVSFDVLVEAGESLSIDADATIALNSTIRMSQPPQQQQQHHSMAQLHKRILELGQWCPPIPALGSDELCVGAVACGGATLITSLTDSAQMQCETSQSTLLGSFTLPMTSNAGGVTVVGSSATEGSSSRAPSFSRDQGLRDTAVSGGAGDDRDGREGASSSCRSYRELDLQHVHHGDAYLIPA